MSEKQINPTTIIREDLYRQVWETPMSRLSAHYGISGNGLKKICGRLNVPCPPRGYWAKLSAGKSVTQTPLPKSPGGIPLQVTIHPTPLPAAAARAPELDPETTGRLHEATARARGITVPAKLRRPHPAIAAWIARREREIGADRRDGRLWGGMFHTKPFTALDRRQQRILSTLFMEAEKLGYKIKGEAPHDLSLEIDRNKVEFTLRERIKQIRRPLSAEEKAGFSSNQQWRQERIPTGELVFTLGTYLGPGLARQWRDGERRLEEQIGDIIALLAIAGPILEKRRQEAEEAQRRHYEEEKRRREEREKLDQDRNRWRRIVQFARLWEEARLAGQLLDVLGKQKPDPDSTYDGRSAAEWLAWARERRDAFDPSLWNVGDLWSDVASVSPWETSRSPLDLDR